MSIPKIAISNEDDASLQILETRIQMTNPSTSPPSPPYKSIIKNRPSLPQTPSSTSSPTTQSYHTCQTRFDSNNTFMNSPLKNKLSDQLQIKRTGIIDENDTENDVSELSQLEDISKLTTNEQNLPKRRDTISTASLSRSTNNSNEYVHKRQYSLRQNRSSNTLNNDNASSYKSSRNSFLPHMTTPPPPLPYAEKNVRNSLTQINSEQQQQQRKSNPVRRTSSYRPSSKSRRFIVHDGKSIEQEPNNSPHSILKRRSTFDNSFYPMTQVETSSIYETPRHEDESNTKNSIRLLTDTNLNAQLAVDNQSDMQLEVSINENTPNQNQSYVSQLSF
jgi:hypothetical protein